MRPDGGTVSQCTGTVDAAYAGTGTAQACAWHHPFDALPPNADDASAVAHIKSGDTLIIDAGSYQMGADWTGATTYASCNTAFPWDCHMQPVPSGTAAAPTRILGAGWNTGCTAAPQLWGSQRVDEVINLEGSSNVVLGCLEITDHSNCIMAHPTASVQCNRGSTYPYGQWADTGISASASNNVTLQDLNIHGLAHYGVLAGGLSNWIVQRVKITGNGWGGWSGDIGAASSNSGTMTFKNLEVGWSGCTENYPSSTIYACWGQNEGGYGDGFGEAKTSGTWLFQDSYFHDNTQDGLDMLYADGSGFVTADRVKATGNAGDQVKITGPSLVQNSILDGNCANWIGVGLMQVSDNCRALGNALVLATTAGASITAQYNSIMSQGDVVILVDGTDASANVKIFNNLLFGQPDYPRQGTLQSAGVYWDSPPSPTPLTITGNYYYETKENATSSCPSGNICATASPNIVNATLAGFDPSLLSGSPLINAATTSASTVPVDFWSKPRPAGGGYDIGAVEYQGASTTVASSVTLSESPNPATAGQTVTITATVTGSGSTKPTGPVTFTDGAKSLGSATLSAGVATFSTSSLSAGAHSIGATYTGDSNFSASSATSTLTVNSSGGTGTGTGTVASATSVSAAPSSLTVGQSVTITAGVRANGSATTTPSGSVTFLDGTTSLGVITLAGGSASYTTSNFSAGAHTIKANYSGDSNFKTSSATTQLSVNSPVAGKTQSATTLTASPNPSTLGQAVKFSATVSGTAPTGSVTFSDQSAALCSSVALSGSGNSKTATCTTSALTAGTHNVKASYVGDSQNTTSTSTSAAEVVNANSAGSGAGTSVNLDQFGLTGSWYDPATSGQGILLQVLPDVVGTGSGILFGGWFTYASAPAGDAEKQRWYTLQGPIDATNPIAQLGIYLTTGGNFNTVPSVSATQVGSATLQFSDCEHGSLSFNFSDGSGRAGKIDLLRADATVACTQTGTTSPTVSNYLMSGGWYSVDSGGQGVVFDVNPTQGLLFAAWYTFTPSGSTSGGIASQRWYTLQSNFPAGTLSKSEIPIYATTGGLFDTPSTTKITQVGLASITFQTCSTATMSYSFSDGANAGLVGRIALQRPGTAPPECDF